jgi:hypothetical protein
LILGGFLYCFPSIHPSIPFPFFVTYCRFTHTPKSQATKWDKDGTCKLQCALESNRPSSVIGRFWCGSTASNAASLAVVLLSLSPVADASCWVKLSANALGHGCDLKRIRARHHSSLPSTHLLSRLSSALWNSPTQKLFILCILIYEQILLIYIFFQSSLFSCQLFSLSSSVIFCYRFFLVF